MWDEHVVSPVFNISPVVAGGKGLDHEEGSGDAFFLLVDSSGSSTMWLGITDFQTPTQNHLWLKCFGMMKPHSWWFQTFFMFHNIWDNPSRWLKFFKGVKTTNQNIFTMKKQSSIAANAMRLRCVTLKTGFMFFCFFAELSLKDHENKHIQK